MLKKILKISALVFLVCPSSAFAATAQYRCNGRIQYRPCNQPLVTANKTYTLQNAQRNAVRASYKYKKAMQENGQLYAEVLKTSYKSFPRPTGSGSDSQWRGFVKGNGDIHLNLQILRNGSIESTRYMGHVQLRNDQTSFNFVSATPPGKNWSWQIIANSSAFN